MPLVYIPKINEKYNGSRRTFLHASVQGQRFCLRDYRSPNLPPREILRNTHSNRLNWDAILEMLAADKNAIFLREGVPGDRRYTESDFWHGFIQNMNDIHLRTEEPPTTLFYLVYIPEINAKYNNSRQTFLHATVQGQEFWLRDYRDPQSPPIEILQNTPANALNWNAILDMQAVDATIFLQQGVPQDRQYTESDFWCAFIQKKNDENNIGMPPPFKGKLQDKFEAELSEALANVRSSPKEVLAKWVGWATLLVDGKDSKFNHWCDHSCVHEITPNTGNGWTSHLIDWCRAGNQLNYVNTNDRFPDLDFALLSMDLNLNFAAGKNPITPGKQQGIKLDGLAVRRDATPAILEVKGPRDTFELRRCICQGVLYAVAVYAKRQMLSRIARQPGKLRPAAPEFRILEQAPSLSVYLLIDTSIYKSPTVQALREVCYPILDAWTPLRDIVLFAVDPHENTFPGKITYDVGFSKMSGQICIF